MRLAQRVGQVPARPVFAAFHAAGAAAGVASLFVSPLDPGHTFAFASLPPAGGLTIIAAPWIWRGSRLALRRGAPP